MCLYIFLETGHRPSINSMKLIHEEKFNKLLILENITIGKSLKNGQKCF